MCPCGPLLVQVFRKADRHDPRLSPDAVCPRRRPMLPIVPREPRPAQCPACGGLKVVPIVYGYPSEELEREAKRGKVVLGGCLIGPDDRKWACRTCDHSWGLVKDESPRPGSRKRRPRP